MEKNSYTYFAKLYDSMMDNIPYDEWEQYLLQLMYRYNVMPGARVAELGCGTGNMTDRLSEDGFRMTGIDLSEDMLEIAREKQGDREAIKYIHADIRDVQLPDKQDVIVSVGDTMNYLLTVNDLSLAMHSAYENLKDGGLLMFDLKTEFFFESEYDGRTFWGKADGIPYVWNNTYDKEKHIHEYHLTFRDGKFRNVKIEERHYQRTYTAKEIAEAAKKAGFGHGAAFDAFTFDKPRTTSERIYIVLFK